MFILRADGKLLWEQQETLPVPTTGGHIISELLSYQGRVV